MAKYNPQEIETKWQAYWEEHQTFKTGTDKSKPKYYCLDMFPYPSGAGLHVGHQKMMVYVDKQYDVVLNKLFKDEDFESYRLMVQMLKSASLYIGAVKIASIAKSMEFACNEGDYDYVRVRHEDLMREYKRIVRAIKERVMDGRAN